MSRQDHDHFAEWDGAYVLGALTPADRSLYEEHMEQCQLCRDSVSELSPMPGLLAQIRPEPESTESEHSQEPADLMNAMLREENQHRSRRRRLAGWAAAAVAVLVLAITVPVALMLQASDDDVSVALEPVDSTPSSMRVEVTLDPTEWGTRLSIECEYSTDMDYREQQTWYALVVTDADGASTQVSTWKAVSGETVTLDAATAVDLDDMDSLTVVTASGEEVLTAPIPE